MLIAKWEHSTPFCFSLCAISILVNKVEHSVAQGTIGNPSHLTVHVLYLQAYPLNFWVPVLHHPTVLRSADPVCPDRVVTNQTLLLPPSRCATSECWPHTS
uniref:Uncharacterized protein n=1 Tax=Anser brachyrhynchus TaxID=132585 RepID=A0A8B9CCH0_9AVES